MLPSTLICVECRDLVHQIHPQAPPTDSCDREVFHGRPVLGRRHMETNGEHLWAAANTWDWMFACMVQVTQVRTREHPLSTDSRVC